MYKIFGIDNKKKGLSHKALCHAFIRQSLLVSVFLI